MHIAFPMAARFVCFSRCSNPYNWFHIYQPNLSYMSFKARCKQKFLIYKDGRANNENDQTATKEAKYLKYEIMQ